MQQHLIQHASEHIAIALCMGCDLHRLGDCAAKAACRSRMLSKNLPANLCCRGRGRCHLRSIGSHDLSSEWLLLIGDLYHIDLAVQSQISACHGQRGSPLTCSGLRCDTLKSLLLRVIRLCDRRIKLMAAACIVSLKLIINLRGCSQRLLQTVRTHQWRRTIHLVKIKNLCRDVNVRSIIVQLLLDQLVTEHRPQVFIAHRL